MATNLPSPQTASTLFASVDMGTNSFKMLIVQANATGKFLTIERLKERVVLGRDFSSSISTESQLRAIESLKRFQQVMQFHNMHLNLTRCVATATVREAENKTGFLKNIHENVGLEVDVLSGEDEARLVYLGMLQFLPIHDKLVLAVDIGGGSTEFVIGKQGKVVFSTSLKLGHVLLTQKFVNDSEVMKLRDYIWLAIEESGLVEKVKECGFEVAVGTSGTVRAIEKAVFYGYARDLVDNEVLFGECKRDWRINGGELRSVVKSLCGGGEGEKIRRQDFFKRRSEFIVAGAVLLEEIFKALGIEEMEVSAYALGEGVIAEILDKVFDGYDLNVNARWRSVVRLATRFNGKKRMKSAAQCANIAKEIFEGLRKCAECADKQDILTVSLNDKDLEYLEAACLLHNIGLCTGKKGYHKQSYHLIMNGDHLHGYSTDEVKLIAMLTRHHRKKFPKFDHVSFKEFPVEVKKKFRILCTIIRISVILQRHQSEIFQEMDFSHSDEGFRLVFKEQRDQPPLVGVVQAIAEDVESELRPELKHFKMVFQQELLVVVPSSSSESSKR